MIESLISQLNESNIKLSDSNSKLSEVEKNYKLFSVDHDALSNISLKQCDELIMEQNQSVYFFIGFLINENQACVI